MSTRKTDYPPLPSNFVVYDHDAPSPRFPQDEVEYIESVRADFSEQELQMIRGIERFAINLNTGGVGGNEIPGLRKRAGEDHFYFRRFSKDPWKAVVQTLMDHVPDEFGDKVRCLMPMLRVTLPNGDRYYPITVLGDLDGWKRNLQQAAAACDSRLGWFDKGKFVLSDGKSIGFSDLKWDQVLRKQRLSKNW